VNVLAASMHRPLPIEASLAAGVGPSDPAEPNPEPQRIPLNSFAGRLDTARANNPNNFKKLL